IKIADNEVYEGVAKGDVVVVTTLYAASATNDDAYSIVEKAEVISGKVSGYKTTTSAGVTSYENVTVDGTTYTLYNKASLLAAIPDETPTTTFADTDIGEEFDLYMVNGYVGAAIQTSESANNYSVVLDVNDAANTAGATFNALKLQVMGADGTKTVITVSDDSAVKTGSGYSVGDIIVYTGSADDAVVTIKGSAASASKTYSEKTKAFGGGVTTSDCVLFAETSTTNVAAGTHTAISGAKYKAYSIRSLDSFTATITTAVTNSDGKVVAVFADLGNTPAGATDTTVYGIVTASNGRVEIDDSYYYQYSVASNDDTYTVNVAAAVLATGDLVSFEPAADATYAVSDLTKITTGGVYVKEYNEADGTLTYFTGKTGSAGAYVGDSTTQTTLALDDDCVIVYVNADDDVAGSEIGVNAFDSVTGYKNAAVVTKTTGSDTVIVAIIVETSNECDIL
ncbi:MAG: hypothetical protein PUC36_07160, partial [Clostridiales bacterium]|nr:hypothetical protein [Clostridiales bacterium]